MQTAGDHAFIVKYSATQLYFEIYMSDLLTFGDEIHSDKTCCC